MAAQFGVQQHIIARRLDPVDRLAAARGAGRGARGPRSRRRRRGGAAAAQRRDLGLELLGAAQRGALRAAAAGALDGLAQPIEADRLQQIIGGVDLEGVGRIMFVGGDEDQLGARIDVDVGGGARGRSCPASGCP